MGDILSISGGVGSYGVIKDTAGAGARTKGVPEVVNLMLVFPFDDYMAGKDQLLVHWCERCQVEAQAANANIASVNFMLGDKLYWDGSKITNVALGNSSMGRALEEKDYSGGVAVGNTLLFELFPAEFGAMGFPVEGVAANYKAARGETALDGANPTPVAHGLTTCVAFTATLKGSAAPGLGTQELTANINGANVDVYAWKPTSSVDSTLIASTGTETFYWVAIGT